MINRKFLGRRALIVLAATVSATAASAQSGLLTRPIDLAPITLAAGTPLAAAPYELETGKQYSLVISADGSAELAIGGAGFFRNVWVNEIVINEIEIRPLGVDSIEFDAAGEAEMTFVTIRPGTFELRIPGTTAPDQAATFNVVDPMFASGATPAAGAGEEEEEEEEDAN
jgi:hypothetical protein